MMVKDTIRLAKQKIFNYGMTPIAEEVLCREKLDRMGSPWDLRLILNIQHVLGELPLHINVFPETFPILNEMEGVLPICRFKDRLVFEVLERGIAPHINCIRSFAEKGYVLAMDDFGRHEANYHLLHEHFPPSVIKIVKLDMAMSRWGIDHIRSLALTLSREGYRVYLEGIADALDDGLSGMAYGELVSGYQGFALHMPEVAEYPMDSSRILINPRPKHGQADREEKAAHG